MKKLRSFITDMDGFSAKDFLMVVFAGAYIVEQLFVFILSLLGKVNPDSLAVIKSLDGIVLTIIGGVFGLQAVRAFKNQPETDYEYHQDTEAAEEDPPPKQP